MIRIITIIFFTIFLIENTQCQIVFGTGQEIPESKIGIWQSKNYSGVYEFGVSELESELIVIQIKNKAYVQLRYYEWVSDENDKVIGTKQNFVNLKNGSIENSEFSAKDYNGKFIMVSNEQGLLLNKNASDRIYENEFGYMLKYLSVKDKFPGDYPIASYTELSKESLKDFSKLQLRLMRNEIFARYSYKFREGGEMHKYFSKKEWYNPENNDVSAFLTELEKKNIELIQELEKNKQTSM